MANVSYDKDTGHFFGSTGKRIGSYTRKYGRVMFKRKPVSMHRLAFYLVEGEWPAEEVDHINGNSHDNRWCNLRKCDRASNMKNRTRYKNSKSGFKGVCKRNGYEKYRAVIKSDNVIYSLGDYDTAEEAAMAYDKAAKSLHADFSNLNFKD
jgi:hypothetical protein